MAGNAVPSGKTDEHGPSVRGLLASIVARPGPQDIASVLQSAPVGALVTAINATVFALSALTTTDPAFLAAWYLMTLAICALAFMRSRRAARRVVTEVSARAARRIVLYAVCLAAPWSLLALNVLRTGNSFDELVVLMVCAGMSAGGTFMLHRTLGAAVAYYATILASVAVSCLHTGLTETWPVMVYAVLYGTFLTYFAHVTGAMARQRDSSVAALSRTIEELRSANDRITQLAFFDAITGLPNRKAFTEKLGMAAGRDGRAPPFGMLLLDLDRFKNINDTLGHQAGDELLAEVGRRLSGLVSAGDMVARLGGDEFAVIAQGVREPQALHRVAMRIIDGVSKPATVAGRIVYPGTSVGAAIYPDHGRDPETLLLNADNALHSAKDSGRGRCGIFDAALAGRLGEADWIEKNLRAALAEGAIRVHYLPKISLATGEMVGVEALVRWSHAERGPLAPDLFLPVAAERGLLPELTAHLFDTIASDAIGWREAGVLVGHVAINIHPVDLKSPDILMQNVRSLIRRGLVTREVVLEITEGCLVGRGTESAAVVLDALADLGFQLSLDDFGTGHASLSHLRSLPVHEIKIDRSFIRGLGSERHDGAIVAAVIEIARGMGLRSVAEGVETPDQLARLQALGADLGQGFLWSEPMHADRVARFLAARSDGADIGSAATG
jgi:diguanylate cyclase